MSAKKRAIWVFGDYRNYFQNRVTLQLLARGSELAAALGAELCAVLIGHKLKEYMWEYCCHGADRVYVMDDPSLEDYSIERYAWILDRLVREHGPEILLIGATDFGREFAPRVAKKLGTGLSADCVDLRIDENGLLVQTAPFYGGNLMAEIVTPEARPQMATVRPGVFKEIPHDNSRKINRVKLEVPSGLPASRVRLISSEKREKQAEKLETARVVICGGRGMGTKKKFRQLSELAGLLGAEIGATRPVVYSKWADHEALVGQAGKTISPHLLLSFGISGAIQHTAAIIDSEFIIAVNKNPNAAMMKMADVAIVADAGQVRTAMVSELRKRLEKDM